LLLLAAALTALAAVPAAGLRFDTDLVSLLPAGGPAVTGYRAFLDRFSGAETVFVLVECPQADDLPEAAAALAEALAGAPEVAEARAGLDPADERFLRETVLPGAVLLPGAEDVESLRRRLAPEAIAARVDLVRDRALSPLGLAAVEWLEADPLGLGESVLSRLGTAGIAADPATGAFLSRDGTAALVIVRPARAEIDPQAGKSLRLSLDRAAAEASRDSGILLRISAVGGSLYAAHDEAAFRRDLVRTISLATVLVGALVVLAFDGLAIPLAAFLAMLAAQIWTAAVLSLGFGRVSAVGLGLGAILVGLGDDYVVHLAARFRDGIAAGAAQLAAMEEAVRETAPGILSAALTTAAAFSVLALARFRPVAELGLFVALGVLITLLTTVLVAGPALALGARRWRPGSSRPVWRLFGSGLDRLVSLGLRHRRAVLAAAVAATLLAAVGATRLVLDPDLRRLRPADPEASRLEVRLAEQFGLGLDTATVVVPGKTLDDALREAGAVGRALRERLPEGARVTSPADLFPAAAEREARLRALDPLPWGRAAADLRAALAEAGLDPDAFGPALAALRALGEGRDPVPARASGVLPSWVTEGIRAGEGGEPVVAVHVRLPLRAWPDGPPAQVRAAVAGVAPGARWASAAWVGAEIREVALTDLRRLGAVALATMAAGVLVSFRGRLRPALLAAIPVALGSLWTFGLWGALGHPLDLFALGILPVLLGIGVDDGLHVLHAVRGGSLEEAVRRSGRGILLTNLTTSVGFGSLVLSQVPGLRNGGVLICAGNLLCLLATFLVLPAIAAPWRAGPRPGSAPRTAR
jgi:predicted RND superfamily exporter protein